MNILSFAIAFLSSSELISNVLYTFLPLSQGVTIDIAMKIRENTTCCACSAYHRKENGYESNEPTT